MNLESIKKAYSKSPDNSALLIMLLDALRNDRQYEEAYKYLKDSECELDTEESFVAADICLKSGNPSKALEYSDENTGEGLVSRAKAYLALGDHKKGLEAYSKAVAISPTLEDPKLEKSLKARVTNVVLPGKGNVLGLRVLSSDSDTEKEDSNLQAEIVQFLAPQQSTIKFKDVGGLDEVKKQIHRKIILPFQKPSLFQKFKKRAGGGVLMYGPPGCGKTLLARATAGECDAKFYNVAISDILDMWIGESEKKLAAIFEQARRTSPSVIFFDELEALAGKRGFSSDNTSSKMVSQFLSEMDGFSQNNQGVLILGATNVPWSIDPAFRRPGRFDRVQFVPPPDKDAREEILKIIADGRPMKSDVDYKHFVKLTSGFSGADLGNLIDTACDIAIEASLEQGVEQEVSMEHLKEAFKEIKPTTSEWLTTARNYAKYSNEGGQYDEVIEFLNKHGK